MNIRNEKLLRWTVTALIACGTAWAGWVSTNISDLHAHQTTLEDRLASIEGKVDVIVDWVKHGDRK